MSKIINIRNQEDYMKFKKDHARGVIFYGSKSCGACTDIKPLYTRIANRYHKQVALAYSDIDECGLDFTVVPIFVSFRKGEEYDNMEGVSTDSLKDFIKAVIKAK